MMKFTKILLVFALISCHTEKESLSDTYMIVNEIISNDKIFNTINIGLGDQGDKIIELDNLYLLDYPEGQFDLRQNDFNDLLIGFNGKGIPNYIFSEQFDLNDTIKFQYDSSHYGKIWDSEKITGIELIDFIDIPWKTNNDSSIFNRSIDFSTCKADSLGGFVEFSIPIISHDKTSAIVASKVMTDSYMIVSFYKMSKSEIVDWIIKSKNRWVFSLYSFDYYLTEDYGVEKRLGVIYLGNI